MRDGKGGWHDAGDFGKYTGNAGFTLGMLLSAFERHPGGLTQAPLPIPERGGALPDYLDELRWELEWMLKMIYAADDGRVSHKLTALGFEGFVAPEDAVFDFSARDDLQTRYFVPFSSAATADFVAALAQASRIYRPYDAEFADRCLAAARAAYALLTANTANTPPDQAAFSTGGYTTTIPTIGCGRPPRCGKRRARPRRSRTSSRASTPCPRPRRWSPPTSTGGRCETWACSRTCCRGARAARRPSSIACARAR